MLKAPDTQVISVHGPSGVLDLTVPGDATVHSVAAEYSRRAGLAGIPLLFTPLGRALPPEASLTDAGVRSGDLVVATSSVHRGAAPASDPRVPAGRRERWPAVWFWVAAACAAASGWQATHAPSGPVRTAALTVLAVGALIGVLPVGTVATWRAASAPVFGGALGFALAWRQGPMTEALAWGTAALAAAAVAAVARIWSDRRDESLVVWMVAGSGTFLLAGLAAILGLADAVVWSLALVAAMLAGRWVPAVAVDVPDQTLIDLERLAVTAWSARERPRGRRGRTVIPPSMVEAVAARAGRTVTASAVAVAVIVVLAAVELVRADLADLDRQGARWLVLLGSASLLLAARSYRHRGARGFLRLGGLGAAATLVWVLLPHGSAPERAWLVGAAIGAGVALVGVAVAVGRGWRSAWWARRAEVAEVVCGSAAVALVCVSTGLFRVLWETSAGMFRA